MKNLDEFIQKSTPQIHNTALYHATNKDLLDLAEAIQGSLKEMEERIIQKKTFFSPFPNTITEQVDMVEQEAFRKLLGKKTPYKTKSAYDLNEVGGFNTKRKRIRRK